MFRVITRYKVVTAFFSLLEHFLKLSAVGASSICMVQRRLMGIYKGHVYLLIKKNENWKN